MHNFAFILIKIFYYISHYSYIHNIIIQTHTYTQCRHVSPAPIIITRKSTCHRTLGILETERHHEYCPIPEWLGDISQNRVQIHRGVQYQSCVDPCTYQFE